MKIIFKTHHQTNFHLSQVTSNFQNLIQNTSSKHNSTLYLKTITKQIFYTQIIILQSQIQNTTHTLKSHLQNTTKRRLYFLSVFILDVSKKIFKKNSLKIKNKIFSKSFSK